MHTHAMRIAGWDVLSPFGGSAETADAINRGLPLPQPGALARQVPGFDLRARLGSKGTRSYDRHTGLLATCIGDVIAHTWPGPDAVCQAAVINGTSAGSVSSILDFMLDTWRHERPYLVNPAHMPNTVLNCAAGQCAIRYGIQGPNATVSAGGQSFYAGLQLAQRWMHKAYAERFLVGAVEEITDDTAHLVPAGGLAPRHGFSEAAGAFALEASRDGLDAAILGVAAATDFSARPDLQGLVDKVLTRAGVDANAVQVVCTESAEGSASRLAEQAVARAMTRARCVDLSAQLGNSLSAAGALQLAALLAVLPAGASGLMVSASGNGSLACALVRQAAEAA
jgi:3-oxoacyl-[acyl-carrier-protein] synthase II